MELRQLPSGQTLTLPDDLQWIDEHLWTPAVASASYLLTGALLIESATRQAGRPITLQAPDDMAWVSRTTVDRIYEWASLPERTFELRLVDGRALTVAFRHQDGAIEAQPVLGFGGLAPDSRWRVSLRLMQV
jgi:hypothetical protein